jgi:hypothetical protein
VAKVATYLALEVGMAAGEPIVSVGAWFYRPLGRPEAGSPR